MDADFDIVVIGGGHAGVEAAWAAARMGLRAALVSLDAATIAQMSCNPAIGGVGKGQIVREIDAMGGLMGLAADATGMQFRMLNRSKGPAVWGPRCQSDRHAYAAWVQAALGRQPNVTIIEGEATGIVVEGGKVVAVKGVTAPEAPAPQALAPSESPTRPFKPSGPWALRCRAVVVTTGTFLNGLMHLGPTTWPGGRYGEPAAASLSDSLRSRGLETGRLKTGTCPRLAAESIDYDQCVRQDGDEPPSPFSFLTGRLEVRQVPCHITATNPAVHQAIRDNLHRAPMFTGQIRSTGPRYCPSLETKIERFADKSSHQIFLEPEGRTTNWIYCNGISTSLPPDVQDAVVRNIGALAKAEILRYGYAIEYDYCPPTQLKVTLETKRVAGLFLAGQINGTTGYEEAAGQGLMAGANAALQAGDAEPLVLRRDQAYIGVMIDDLVTKGITEPYRMFTSRAEHRLHLRADNADRRLTPVARSIGLADDQRWDRYRRKDQTIRQALPLLKFIRLVGTGTGTGTGPVKSLWDHLRSPDADLSDLVAKAGGVAATAGKAGAAAGTAAGAWAELAACIAADPEAIATLATDGRYAGYLEKEEIALRAMQDLEKKRIPEDVDYQAVSHLRHEARERLQAIRPASLGQALRISGITPADVTVLAIHLTARGGKMDNI